MQKTTYMYLVGLHQRILADPSFFTFNVSFVGLYSRLVINLDLRCKGVSRKNIYKYTLGVLKMFKYFKESHSRFSEFNYDQNTLHYTVSVLSILKVRPICNVSCILCVDNPYNYG